MAESGMAHALAVVAPIGFVCGQNRTKERGVTGAGRAVKRAITSSS